MNVKKNINNVFTKINKEGSKTTYHTKIFSDFFTFGVNQKEKGKFFIALRGLFDKEKKNTFHLFSPKKGTNDKFLGVFYGFKRLNRPILIRYEDNIKQSSESTIIYKPYYIEFRFKRGSIFCYIRAMHVLTKKGKFNKKYVQSLLGRIINLENEVYKFYDKKLPEGGVITKWVEKNQK
ncbi:DUF226 domain-containing protein [Borrelia persica]|uniref:DUF226 domain-containing protein n=1 Tax=Borrelia persica TaxID=44448 RepID=UPI0004B53EFD|nr:DUF226 domain-containing protein [Borrelia persica]